MQRHSITVNTTTRGVVLMVLLLMLRAIDSSSVDPCGGQGCKHVSFRSSLHFRLLHDENVASSSVAPWTLRYDVMEGREPETIRKAECASCTVDGLMARPIFVQIQVHHRRRNGTNTTGWCRCPHKVPVGCTCVRE